jgi:hypothetical protein
LEISHVATHISSLLRLHTRIQEISTDVPIDVAPIVVVIIVVTVAAIIVVTVAIVVVIRIVILVVAFAASVVAFMAAIFRIVGWDIIGRLMQCI